MRWEREESDSYKRLIEIKILVFCLLMLWLWPCRTVFSLNLSSDIDFSTPKECKKLTLEFKPDAILIVSRDSAFFQVPCEEFMLVFWFNSSYFRESIFIAFDSFMDYLDIVNKSLTWKKPKTFVWFILATTQVSPEVNRVRSIMPGPLKPFFNQTLNPIAIEETNVFLVGIFF